MFACVYYQDKQVAKVPVGYIKKFDLERYVRNTNEVYKVFWNRHIKSLQTEDELTMAELSSLNGPPPKDSWNREVGDGYYQAHVLRIEDSLYALVESLKEKRPSLPAALEFEDSVTSNTEEETLKSMKSNKKREDNETKKKILDTKKSRAEMILSTARRTRKEKFKQLNFNEETEDSEEDPEVIPKHKYDDLQASFSRLSKEKDEIEERYLKLKESYATLKAENEEVGELRRLNRELQDRLLNQPLAQGECHGNAEASSDISSESGSTEIALGAGIFMDKNVYRELLQLNHVRKFTKSLAVAIWGSETLSERSVVGRPCRNRGGPKKNDGAPKTDLQLPAKPPLTPEKLAVVSAQMRNFLQKKGCDATQIETALKQRNKIISDKIMEIRKMYK